MYASIIVDISHEQLDKVFQYKIPNRLSDSIQVGSLVFIPFGRGNRQIKGYVIDITNKLEASIDASCIKEIISVKEGSIPVEAQMIQLASWMKKHYGSTMNQALKTVMPIKTEVKNIEKKWIKSLVDSTTLQAALEEARRKKYVARVRLLELLVKQPVLSKYELEKKKISSKTLEPLIEKGLICLEKERQYRNPVLEYMNRLPKTKESQQIILNENQQNIVDSITHNIEQKDLKPCVIHGITGSGKTEVYMELISYVISKGKQAIVLIPEISLTYQTIFRFYKRFGNRVSMVNSRQSQGEKFDQMERAKNGEIDVMIGPRTALFTPFSNLGLIIIDEEHEGAYKSDTMPRFHARETAIERARMSNGLVVLGSATPSVESYYKAKHGLYHLYYLGKRAVSSSQLANTHIVDLREELKKGNKSIFSETLHKLILDRLQKKEQIILFLNRRGYAGFVSCRFCGNVIKCPHCDVSLNAHNNGTLVCHYCNYTIPFPKHCPSCSSNYIATFGLGTQKVEAMVHKQFPMARTLRMDMDTTSKKGEHEAILNSFSSQQADILIGTQMIVKGHDFPNVTLVGILAADLSLHTSSYRSSEITFQLLTQAAGRAGRGEKSGDVVIQTYDPEHYSIVTSAQQDYVAFYEKEIAYRKMLSYPPIGHLLALLVTSSDEALAQEGILCFANEINIAFGKKIQIIGPTNASVSKIKDSYRKLLYIKAMNNDTLIEVKDKIEELQEMYYKNKKIFLQFDFSS